MTLVSLRNVGDPLMAVLEGAAQYLCRRLRGREESPPLRAVSHSTRLCHSIRLYWAFGGVALGVGRGRVAAAEAQKHLRVAAAALCRFNGARGRAKRSLRRAQNRKSEDEATVYSRGRRRTAELCPIELALVPDANWLPRTYFIRNFQFMICKYLV